MEPLNLSHKFRINPYQRCDIQCPKCQFSKTRVSMPRPLTLAIACNTMHLTHMACLWAFPLHLTPGWGPCQATVLNLIIRFTTVTLTVSWLMLCNYLKMTHVTLGRLLHLKGTTGWMLLYHHEKCAGHNGCTNGSLCGVQMEKQKSTALRNSPPAKTIYL